MRVAGRRFAEIVKSQGLDVGHWIELAPSVKGSQQLTENWNKRLRLAGSVPAWEDGQFDERPEPFLDLSELEIKLRRKKQR